MASPALRSKVHLGCMSGNLVGSRGWGTCLDDTGISSGCYWLLGETPSRMPVVPQAEGM